MTFPRRIAHVLAPCLLLAAGAAEAQEFALSASPPRFELMVKPGETSRSVIELENPATAPASFAVATADWALTADGGVVLDRALRPASCRPWVALEQHRVTLAGKGRLRFRFEVTPPAGTPAGECRFAIVISGADQTVHAKGGLDLPVSGQIAIIVYAALGGARPRLEIAKADVVTINGIPTPVLQVRNDGAAHGRLQARLTGSDAAGRKRAFSISGLPVLPGETRMLALSPDDGGDAIALDGKAEPGPGRPIAYPLRISGTLNDGTRSFSFQGMFAP